MSKLSAGQVCRPASRALATKTILFVALLTACWVGAVIAKAWSENREARVSAETEIARMARATATMRQISEELSGMLDTPMARWSDVDRERAEALWSRLGRCRKGSCDAFQIPADGAATGPSTGVPGARRAKPMV